MFHLPIRYCVAHPGTAPYQVNDILKVPRSEIALVLVDVYCGVQDGENIEGMTLGLTDVWNELMEERLAPATRAARAAGLPVIYVMNSAPRLCLENWVLGQKLKQSFNIDFGHAFREGGVDPLEYHTGRAGRLAVHPGLEPQPTDLYIRKHVYSGFYETRLDTALRNLGARYLVMAGMWLDACLMATMLDALYRNYRVILLRDAALAGGEDPDSALAKTEQQVIWTETLIGCSTTCMEFQAACEGAGK
jgi:ureidoacrylate peracid hydrolase